MFNRTGRLLLLLKLMLALMFVISNCYAEELSAARSVSNTEDTEHVYSLPRAEAKEIGLSSENLAEFSAFIQKGVDEERIPGAVALIARHGKIGYFESFGLQDLDTEAPMKKDTIFRIYSMTKPIVSAAVLILMDDGLLSFNDPVSKYIPELGGLKVGVEGISSQRDMTVLDLLRHTSGITYGVFFDSKVKTLYKKAGVQDNNQTIAEMVAKLGKLPLAYQPGTRWEYGRSTDVLGRLIEIVSGQSLDRFLEKRIFKPLKMVDTGFYVKPENIHRLAEADLYIEVRSPPKMLSGGGGLTSTAGDYVRFAQMLLNGGELEGTRILKKETIDLMTRDHLGPMANRDDPQYLPSPTFGFGLGVAVKIKPEGISMGYYRWEGWAGTMFSVNPKTNSIGILMFQEPAQLLYYIKNFSSYKMKSLVLEE